MFNLSATPQEPKLTPAQIAKVQHSAKSWERIREYNSRYIANENYYPNSENSEKVVGTTAKSLINNEMVLEAIKKIGHAETCFNIVAQTTLHQSAVYTALKRLVNLGKVDTLTRPLNRGTQFVYALPVISEVSQ